MEKIINVERMRSMLRKDSSAKVSEFEIYLIQEGVKQILLGNNINGAMLKFLEDIDVVKVDVINTYIKNVSIENQKKIKDSLKNHDYFKSNWDYNGLMNNANFFGTQKDWNQTLIKEINEISSAIHEKTFNGGANLIIINPKLEPILENLEYFHDNYQECNGYCKVGMLGRRYSIISTFNIAEKDEIILCRKEINEEIEETIFKEHYGIIKVLGYKN